MSISTRHASLDMSQKGRNASRRWETGTWLCGFRTKGNSLQFPHLVRLRAQVTRMPFQRSWPRKCPTPKGPLSSSKARLLVHCRHSPCLAHMMPAGMSPMDLIRLYPHREQRLVARVRARSRQLRRRTPTTYRRPGQTSPQAWLSAGFLGLGVPSPIRLSRDARVLHRVGAGTVRPRHLSCRALAA